MGIIKWSLQRRQDREQDEKEQRRLLHLTSRKKWSTANDNNSRIKPARETLDKVIPIAKRIGVTRVADITYMDKLYIPNYSIVLPGTEDTIWVYSGKGVTEENAKASGLMESIERYSSLPSTNSWRDFIRGSYDELSKKYKRSRILHPADVVESLRYEYKNDMIMDFLIGVDLFTKQEILVPAPLALYGYSPKPKQNPKSSSFFSSTASSVPVVDPFEYRHTNGLASGNVIEEAICHALCEVIERDAVSIADLCASYLPYTLLKRIANSFIEKGYLINSIHNTIDQKYVDYNGMHPDVDISEVVDYEPVKDLVKRFAKAQQPLYIKDVTSDIGIPTILASSFEWISHDYALFAYGQGTHPDSRIALIRAITELSQTRATYTQGARDDLKKIIYKEADYENHTRSWKFLGSRQQQQKKMIKFGQIKSYVNDDILDDIRLILKNLKRAGLDRAIIVDLTNPAIGIPVVRAIVPGLETFDVMHSVIGKRARESFFRNVSRR